MLLSVINTETGRSYKRKGRTTDAIMIYDVQDVYKMLIGERRTAYLKALERITIYFDSHTYQLGLFETNHSLAIGLKVKRQNRGERLYWICPRSGKQVSLLYLIQTDTGPVIGSREGLGLCHPSQALHRTPLYDGAVYSGLLKTTRAVHYRAFMRKNRRYAKVLRRLVQEFA